MRVAMSKTLFNCQRAKSLKGNYREAVQFNYHLRFGKIKKVFDPNGIGENTGLACAGKDTAGAHTLI
jgi:hypothetical protein